MNKMNKMNKIVWAKFSETAIIPTKRREDAGYDLYEDENRKECDFYVMQPFETKKFNTNIGVVIPYGYAGIVKKRSSHGKLPIYLGADTVDSGFRGSIGVYMTNSSPDPVTLSIKHAIAQLVIIKSKHIESEQNDDNCFKTTPEEFAILYPSERGITKEGKSGK
jgi:dUTPase